MLSVEVPQPTKPAEGFGRTVFAWDVKGVTPDEAEIIREAVREAVDYTLVRLGRR